MLIAHRIALNPNKAQALYLARAAGTARFAFNWALGEWKRQAQEWWESGKTAPFPSEISLRKQFNAVKREQYPWTLEVSKCVVQEAIIDLGIAFRNYKSVTHKGHYPTFKSKTKSSPSFCAANEAGTFRADGKRIKLPVVGWIRMRETVRFAGPLKRATVSRTAGRWFVSVLVDADNIKPIERPTVPRVVGVDLGVTTLAMLSTGEAAEGPKAHKNALARLRRANKAQARKVRGSANFKKAKARLAKLHARVANIRRDACHKLTHRLVHQFDRIGIEDLNVRGMVRNGHLARAISDAGFGEFRRMIEYKAKFYGATVVVADRFFPSSKTCSCCGVVADKMPLSVRAWTCEDCGATHDRDLNAARNLERMAGSLSVSACGDIRAGAPRKSRVKRKSVKQEENETPIA
ncbi:MAG: RNA-guided endonuclease TnpB family protein [Gallionella sp.]